MVKIVALFIQAIRKGTSYLKYRHIIPDHNIVSKVPMKGLIGEDAFFTSSIMRGWESIPRFKRARDWST